MKLEDMQSPALREWAKDYMAQKLAANDGKEKAAKRDELRRLWSGWRESDWEAWRELQELRPRAIAEADKGNLRAKVGDRKGQEALDFYIQRKLAMLPRDARGYSAPYTYGFEVAALLDLLGEEPRSRVEVTDFNP